MNLNCDCSLCSRQQDFHVVTVPCRSASIILCIVRFTRLFYVLHYLSLSGKHQQTSINH